MGILRQLGFRMPVTVNKSKRRYNRRDGLPECKPSENQQGPRQARATNRPRSPGLLQGGQAGASTVTGRSSSGVVVADHAIRVRAESAYARLPGGCRQSVNREINVDAATGNSCGNCEVIAALWLGSGGRIGQHIIKQTRSR
jgi:hypothetical protein